MNKNTNANANIKMYCLICRLKNMKLSNQIYLSESDYNRKIINKILSCNKIINLNNNLINSNEKISVSNKLNQPKNIYKKIIFLFSLFYFYLSIFN